MMELMLGRKKPGYGVPAIGDPFEGGYYGGLIQWPTGEIYALVTAPVSSTMTLIAKSSWNTVESPSLFDGALNTASQVAGGVGSTHAAGYCNNYVNQGYSDWYLPALFELEIFYFNLKPTNVDNSTNAGANPYAVPPRNTNYTNSPKVPSITQSPAFMSPVGQQAFDAAYWTSTSDTAFTIYRINFVSGAEPLTSPNNYFQVRPIRKVQVG